MVRASDKRAKNKSFKKFEILEDDKRRGGWVGQWSDIMFEGKHQISCIEIKVLNVTLCANLTNKG